VLFITGFAGHVLCLPLALFAAWRGGLLPLWAPIAFSATMVAAEAVQPFGSGLLLLAVALVALAYAFSKMDWRSRGAQQ
jgi:hypothetical protein